MPCLRQTNTATRTENLQYVGLVVEALDMELYADTAIGVAGKGKFSSTPLFQSRPFLFPIIVLVRQSPVPYQNPIALNRAGEGIVLYKVSLICHSFRLSYPANVVRITMTRAIWSHLWGACRRVCRTRLYCYYQAKIKEQDNICAHRRNKAKAKED